MRSRIKTRAWPIPPEPRFDALRVGQGRAMPRNAKRKLAGAGAGVLIMASGASAALAQTHVGSDAYRGLHWSVAALQGAAWRLECRFRPVTVWISTYERDR